MSQPAQLPGARQRRALVTENSPKLAQAGKEYLAAGRWGEALECLSAAGEKESLIQLAQQAAEVGDIFYWQAALKAMGQKPSADEKDNLARVARESGKLAFAQKAE